MDDTTAELLSRFVDDDLDPGERERVLELRRSDPEVAAELAALVELQRSVRSLAASSRPPATLDLLVDPLRRRRARRRVVRPAFGWLAAAASVVLAATLGLEVMRRSPGPELAPARARAVPTAPTPVVEKIRPTSETAPAPAPAPTSDAEALGALDHLLEAPLKGPRLEAEAPPPLVVVGPLEDRREAAAAEITDLTGETRPGAPATPSKAGREMTRRALRAERPSAKAWPAPAEQGTPLCRLVLTVSGRRVALPCAIEAGDGERRLVLDLTVEHGAITAMSTVPAEGLGGTAGIDRSAVSLVGLAAPEVPDGRYRGVLTISATTAAARDRD